MKKLTHSWKYNKKRQNLGIFSFFRSHLFTFHSSAQLLLPTVKLGGVSQPISIEYKVAHGLNQAVLMP